MGVDSYHAIQYTITCDKCDFQELCPDNKAESVYSKQQAIKWAGFHKTKDGVLCDECFKNRVKE